MRFFIRGSRGRHAKPRTIKDSTRRALRTLYQGILTLCVVLPVLMVATPEWLALEVKLAGFAAAVAGVSQVINSLEDSGLIPCWLKEAP